MIKQVGSGGFDKGAGCCGFVERSAVHDDVLSRFEFGSEDFFHPGIEHACIGVAFEAHGSLEHTRAVACDQRGSADAFAGDVAHRPLAARRSGMGAKEAFFDTRFIHPYDPLRRNLRDYGVERGAFHFVAFGVEQRFFYG